VKLVDDEYTAGRLRSSLAELSHGWEARHLALTQWMMRMREPARPLKEETRIQKRKKLFFGCMWNFCEFTFVYLAFWEIHERINWMRELIGWKTENYAFLESFCSFDQWKIHRHFTQLHNPKKPARHAKYLNRVPSYLTFTVQRRNDHSTLTKLTDHRCGIYSLFIETPTLPVIKKVTTIFPDCVCQNLHSHAITSINNK